MKKFTGCFADSTLYKSVCVCAFMLVPSVVFCFFPQLVSIVLLLWGALFLLRDLKHGNYLKQTGSILLLLFCLGYIVTLVLYAKNDIVSTIHIFCWTIIEFFLLFAVDRDRQISHEALLMEMYKINTAISVVCFLSGIASLIIFFAKVSVVMPDPEGLNAFWSMGVVNGRNSGIFNNAIPCANAMFIGCVSALYNLLHSKKKNLMQHLFYGATIVVCYLVILTTLTRTYIYGLYIFSFMAVFAASIQRQKGTPARKVKKVISTTVLAVAVVAVLAVTTETSKNVLEKAVQDVSINSVVLNMEGFHEQVDSQMEAPATDAATDVATEPTESTITEDELKEQISNRLGLTAEITMERNELNRLPSFLYPRDELWKVALEVIPHSPVLGFTSGNRNASSLEYGTSDFLKNNWTDGIPTYHNAYFDIAVSAGLLGLSLFVVFLAIQVFKTLRTLFVRELDISKKREKWAFGVLGAYLATHVFVISMFFGVLCFSNISVCLYFWIVLGYVSLINDHCDGGKSILSANALVEKVLKLKGKKYER